MEGCEWGPGAGAEGDDAGDEGLEDFGAQERAVADDMVGGGRPEDGWHGEVACRLVWL